MSRVFSGIILLLIVTAFSAGAQVQFQRIGAREGLSQSSVIAIDQDKLGFMWFGTRDGLNKYDGEKITVYRYDSNEKCSLSNNDILDIAPASDGDVWIGTYHGLNHYDAQEEKFTRYQSSNQNNNSISSNTIWSVLVEDDYVLAGTANGLNRLDLKTGKFTSYFHDPDNERSLSANRITSLYKDRQNTLWVGTDNGLNKVIHIDSGNIICQNIQLEGLNEAVFIQAIIQNRQGNLILGTDQHGLIIYDKISQQWHRYHTGNGLLHNSVRALTLDKLGRVWIGTYAGINLLDASGKITSIQHQPDNVHSLSKNTIKSLYCDKYGSVWAGAYYGGVNMWNKSNFNFTNIYQQSDKFGLNYNVISSITEYENLLIIGTEGGGVNLFDRRKNQFTYLTKQNSKLPSNNIKSLRLENHHLWIGTYQAGLCRYNLKSQKIDKFINETTGLSSNSVYNIAPYQKSQYWIATFMRGINYWDSRQNKIIPVVQNENKGSLTDNQVRVLMVDKQDNLWIGTQNGINFLSAEKINNQNFTFEYFLYSSISGSGEDIFALYQDKQGNIWCGSKENGLHLFENQKFKKIELFSGLENGSNTVHAILEDRMGNLWLSSNNGIVKFNPYAGKSKLFQVADGLVSNEFNNNAAYKSKDGTFYFGGPMGISSFKPNAIQTNTEVPEVVFTGLRVNGEKIMPAKSKILGQSIQYSEILTLKYYQSNFTVNFSLPNFINPDKNKYAYKLVGLEEEWNYTHEGQANYTIQNKGDYTLLVKGANNDGIWSEPRTLMIAVKPSPWRSGWAFAGYASAIILALGFWLKIIQSRSRIMHNLELTQKQKEQDMQLSQMKLQFFTNISHDFRTPLTLIIGPLTEIIENYRGSNKIYKQLNAVYHNAEHLLKLINQLMDFRKLESRQLNLQAAEGNIVKFCHEIFLSFSQYAKSAKYNYQFSSSHDEISIFYDRDKMEKVLYNLLSNAFKFTPEGGEIKMEVKKENGKVGIYVIDSGIGINKKYVERVFDRFYQIDDQKQGEVKRGTGIGLALCKGIIDLHKGIIEVTSKEGIGSTFKIVLPTGSQHLSGEEIIIDFKNSETITGYHEQLQSAEKNLVDQLPKIPENKDKTILIVEDNDEIRNFIVSLLQDSYMVIQAADGKEGISRSMADVPDLIISDIMMPEMDGIEFCQKVKSDLKTSHIPVLLLTARTSLIYKMQGLESGADDYITKPFNIKELLLKVRNHLQATDRLREKFQRIGEVVPGEVTVSSIDEELLQRAINVMEENISNEFFDIPLFCDELGVSRTMLFTKIKAWTNMTPNEFIQSMRMKRAVQLLEQNKLSISQICYKVGYKNPKYFSRSFQKHFKLTPSQYQEKFKNDIFENE